MPYKKFWSWCFGIFLLPGSFALAAGSWETILKSGWTPPSSFLMYAYSEYTPPYVQGVRAYETLIREPAAVKASEAFGEFYDPKFPDHYRIGAFEEFAQLRPGMAHLARHLLKDLQQLADGDPPGEGTLKGIPEFLIKDNPYWPSDLPKRKDHPALRNQPIVALLPLSLSRINEELGKKHPWAVYGNSELDPETIFWERTLGGAPEKFLCRLLNEALKIDATESCKLKELGLRIFTRKAALIPEALRDLILPADPGAEDLKAIKVLLTFEPFGGKSEEQKKEKGRFWPPSLRTAYGQALFPVIPHPTSLVFFGSTYFRRLAEVSGNPEVLQIPLAQELSNFGRGLADLDFYGLRVLDVSRRKHRFFSKREKSPAGPAPIGAAAVMTDEEGGVFDQIFSPNARVMGLYGKPIAKNVELWAEMGPLAKDPLYFRGPTANLAKIESTRDRVFADRGASRVHYRNYFLPMQINGYTARWYRPLVAWKIPGEKAVADFSLPGSVALTNAEQTVWLPVAVLDRDGDSDLLKADTQTMDEESGLRQTDNRMNAYNAKKIFEFQRMLRPELPRLSADFATALLNPTLKPNERYGDWVKGLPPKLAERLNRVVDAGLPTPTSESLSFERTRKAEFALSYWRKIVELTEGPLRDVKGSPFEKKNNTDCAGTDEDKPNEFDGKHCKENQLPDVLTYLRRYYESEKLDEIFVHEFDWAVPIPVPFWGGLKQKQKNLIVRIPGRDHSKVVILADHYDTAFRQDHYDGKIYSIKGEAHDVDAPQFAGHRHAAKGADDNHSGTAALMVAAPILRDLKLKYDVWILHATGEEFPADCLGARALIQALVEKKRLTDAKMNPQVLGIYQLDMIAHHSDRDKDPKAGAVFQISPGRGEGAAKLAYLAHRATQTYNRELVGKEWNKDPERKGPWKRVSTVRPRPAEEYLTTKFPNAIALHGEIRPGWHYRSSLFNTDGQPYSDAGVPVVLFMENYDIERRGYHDTLDDLGNIDLDYGAGLTQIVVESVAQAANRM